jgi:elongation factor G
MTRFRNVAIVGPYSSGKTTLLENLLYIGGAITRRGSVRNGNTVGDASAEARDRQMSTEITAASLEHGSLCFTFLDCPGSIELMQESLNALVGVDAAVVVCEPDPQKVLTLSPLFRFLDDQEIPHFVFLNKMDRMSASFQDVIASLKQVSSRPLVLQQYPIATEDSVTGFIDLITEQAYQYHADAPADPIPFPEELRDLEHQARTEMLEMLAEFDDHLLEELLEDINPPEAEVVHDLQAEVESDLIVPVLLGVAEQGFGVSQLLTTLVNELPDTLSAAHRHQVGDKAAPIAQVLKTFISPQGGKLSLVRVWQGILSDGMTLNGVRVSGLYRMFGQTQTSLGQAEAGDIVALGRMEGIQTGDALSVGNTVTLPGAEQIAPVFSLAIKPQNRKDEVKLTTALNKLIEEDPSISWEHRESTHEIVLWGQGDIHLQITKERLERKYNLPLESHAPHVPYRETIRKSTKSHGRYKHQTGGHGQFGDVHLDIQPRGRGEGFQFNESIVGGVVPKQYIPGVETGVREFLDKGLYGFPIVDISVTLTDGSYHTVDSSEQAFKQAARLAMQSGLPDCQPILLEPVERVTLATPSEFTSSILKLITNRRGQVLGYDAKSGWMNWDEVTAYIPMAEMQDMILELRSVTQGVGFFQWQDDHLEEVPDKITERVLATVNGGNGNSK